MSKEDGHDPAQRYTAVIAQPLHEVAPFLVLRAKPGDGPVCEHRVQDHQALDRPVDCDTSAIPVVRITEGRIERLVLHVEDPRSSGRAELDWRRESPDEQPLNEVVNLLPVRNAGKRCVLPADEDPGMPHHCDEETGLPMGEAKRRERSIALAG